MAVEPDGENPSVPIMAWNTCAYTIQVIGITNYLIILLTTIGPGFGIWIPQALNLYSWTTFGF